MTDTEVLDAAGALVAAFGAHDTEGYFAAFAPDATFVFHTTPVVLTSREEYERLWASWETTGFRVEACESFDQRVQMVSDDVAVFTHRVRTWLAGSTGAEAERETIAFRRGQSGRWLAVHEHLSPDPDPVDAP